MNVLIPNGGKFKVATVNNPEIYKSSWLEGTGTTVFAHGLTSAPDVVELWYDDNGTIISLDKSNISAIDSTNITIDFAGITVDSTHKVRIIAYAI